MKPHYAGHYAGLFARTDILTNSLPATFVVEYSNTKTKNQLQNLIFDVCVTVCFTLLYVHVFGNCADLAWTSCVIQYNPWPDRTLHMFVKLHICKRNGEKGCKGFFV